MSTLTFTENAEIRFKARAGQVNIDQAKGIVECFVAAIAVSYTHLTLPTNREV